MARDLSHARAILIGNGRFQGPQIGDLPALECVAAMSERLTSDLCGWPAERIAKLEDVAKPDDLARQVIAAVRNAQDVLLVYYAGHGYRTRTGKLALAVGETDPDAETLPFTAMLYEDLADILRGCRAATKLVILDCCHAELGGKDNFVFQGADLAEAYPVDGLYFIGASKSNEKAKTPKGGQLTYFTQALVDVVHDGIPGLGPELQLDHIFLELRARLVKARLPEPVESGIRGARQYPFARNTAWPAVTPAPLPEPLAQPPADLRPARKHRRVRPELLAAVASIATLILFLSGDGGAAGIITPITLGPAKPAAALHAPGSPAAVLATPDHYDIQGVALSPGGKLIAAAAAGKGSPGGSTFVWDTASRQLTATFTNPGGITPDAVAFAPVGPDIAVGDANADTYLWDVRDHSLTASLSQPSGFDVFALAYSPDGKTLAVGDGNGDTSLWDVRARSIVANFSDPHGQAVVESVAYSPDGKTLAMVDDNGTAYLWNLATRHLRATIAFGDAVTGVTAIAFSPDGKTLAVVEGHSVVQLWDMTTRTFTTTISYPGSAPAAVAFSPDGKTLAIGDSSGTCYLWDRSTRSVAATLRGVPPWSVGGLQFSRDSKTVAIYPGNDRVYLYHVG